jgi:signal transduction histidine kinase
LTVALSAVLLAIALFGIPLAGAIQRTITGEERNELEQLGLRGAVAVSPGYRHDLVELPPAQADQMLAVYTVAGRRVTGVGPGRTDVRSVVASRQVASTDTSTQREVLVPVTSGERLIAVIRAASDRSSLSHRIWWAWAGLGLLALFATAGAGVLAAAQSRRLSRPMVALERAATELGDGNFAVDTERSGVPEIDRAAASLDRTARRLADLLTRERAFSVHASHQLRTPLTTLRLQLETGLQGDSDALVAAATAAISSADQLEQTIDDVLALARGSDGRGRGFDVDELFDEVRQRWHGTLASADRPLRFIVDDAVSSNASWAATRQILDVLVDNAVQHGSGAVTLRARESGGALAIDVMDEGTAHDRLATAVTGRLDSAAGGDALGLPLARSLAEAEGGRLLLAGQEPHTQLTLLLPSDSANGDDAANDSR